MSTDRVLSSTISLNTSARSPKHLQALVIQVDRCFDQKYKMATILIMVFMKDYARNFSDSIFGRTMFVSLCGYIWFGLLLYVPVNSYGHVGIVSSSNHTIFLGKLEQAINKYCVHILRLLLVWINEIKQFKLHVDLLFKQYTVKLVLSGH